MGYTGGLDEEGAGAGFQEYLGGRTDPICWLMASGNDGGGGAKKEAQVLVRLWVGGCEWVGGHATHSTRRPSSRLAWGLQEAEEMGCGLHKLDVGPWSSGGRYRTERYRPVSSVLRHTLCQLWKCVIFLSFICCFNIIVFPHSPHQKKTTPIIKWIIYQIS